MSIFLSNQGQHETITTGKQLSKVPPSSVFAIDIETHGKPVGDNPYSDKHGICGISICNFQARSAYIVVNDNREYQGLNIKYVIDFLNANWFKENSVAVFHNCKFDLGFLLERGLDISKVRIHDTYLIRTMLRHGIFVSNALKDVIRELFGVATDSQDVIKKWLEANNTQDYGDIPIKTMAPYACDDTRYTLALLEHDAPLIDADMRRLHDMYVRNILNLIAAEKTGVCLNKALMRERFKQVQEQLKECGEKLREQLNGVDIDFNDDQKMLAYLNSKNLHPGPRNYFGEMQYVLDTEYLKSVDTELSEAYMRFARKKKFIEQFYGDKITDRRFEKDNNIGFHPSFFPSTFSRGAIVHAKTPDFVDDVKLTELIRRLFVPRHGHRFIAVRCQDLPLQLLAWYCNDEDILQAVGSGGEQLCQAYSNRNALGMDANSLLLRRIVEGSGFAVLERRMKIARVKGVNKNSQYRIQTEFEASLPGFKETMVNLINAAQDSPVRDRGGRRVAIPQDKHYRAHAILINSSVGSILSTYFDVLCRAMHSAGAHLVFAHEKDWLFEAPENNEVAPVVAAKVLTKPLTEPAPKFILRDLKAQMPWTCPTSDAHEVLTDRWL